MSQRRQEEGEVGQWQREGVPCPCARVGGGQTTGGGQSCDLGKLCLCSWPLSPKGWPQGGLDGGFRANGLDEEPAGRGWGAGVGRSAAGIFPAGNSDPPAGPVPGSLPLLAWHQSRAVTAAGNGVPLTYPRGHLCSSVVGPQTCFYPMAVTSCVSAPGLGAVYC